MELVASAAVPHQGAVTHPHPHPPPRHCFFLPDLPHFLGSSGDSSPSLQGTALPIQMKQLQHTHASHMAGSSGEMWNLI